MSSTGSVDAQPFQIHEKSYDLGYKDGVAAMRETVIRLQEQVAQLESLLEDADDADGSM